MKRFGRITSLLVALCLIFTAAAVCVSAEDKAGVGLGDVNCDGKVNVADAALILKYIADWDLSEYSFSYENADINRDGKINISDAAALLRCAF